MSPFMSMGSMNSMTSGLAGMNPALLYQMAAQQAPQQMVWLHQDVKIIISGPTPFKLIDEMKKCC